LGTHTYDISTQEGAHGEGASARVEKEPLEERGVRWPIQVVEKESIVMSIIPEIAARRDAKFRGYPEGYDCHEFSVKYSRKHAHGLGPCGSLHPTAQKSCETEAPKIL